LSKEQLNPFYFTASSGIGIDYKFNKRMFVGFNSEYEMTINSIRKAVGDAQVKTSLRSVKGFLSFGYRL